jgi:hypothetical protein
MRVRKTLVADHAFSTRLSVVRQTNFPQDPGLTRRPIHIGARDCSRPQRARDLMDPGFRVWI